MARIYWQILDCGGKTECCCRCPSLHINEDNPSDQACCNLALIGRRSAKRRKIENCVTPDWCPLPQKDATKEIIGVTPIYKE